MSQNKKMKKKLSTPASLFWFCFVQRFSADSSRLISMLKPNCASIRFVKIWWKRAKIAPAPRLPLAESAKSAISGLTNLCKPPTKQRNNGDFQLAKSELNQSGGRDFRFENGILLILRACAAEAAGKRVAANAKDEKRKFWAMRFSRFGERGSLRGEANRVLLALTAALRKTRRNDFIAANFFNQLTPRVRADANILPRVRVKKTNENCARHPITMPSCGQRGTEMLGAANIRFACWF